MASTMKFRPSPNEEARIIQEDKERRRKLRIIQVREQAKINAAKIRESVRAEKEKALNELALQLMTKHETERNEKLKELEETYRQNLKNVGQAHRDAANFDPKTEERARKHEQNLKLAAKRHQKALQQLHEEQQRKNEEEKRRILNRQAALEYEKMRANEVASRPPPPPDPVKNLEIPKVKPIKVTDLNAFSSTHYHIKNDVHVEKAMSAEQRDAFQAAEEEEEEIDQVQKEKKIALEEQREKARLRYLNARRKEGLKQDYNQLLHDLSDLQHKDVHRRQQAVAKIPKQIFVPPHQRAELRADHQHAVEREFEEMYMAATDYAGDLSLALDPHPPPEVPKAVDGLDLTIEEDVSDEEPIPPAHDHREHGIQRIAGQPSSEVDVTLRSREQETGLWKLLSRIKSQRDSWITKGRQEKPKPEKSIGKEEVSEGKVLKPTPKVDAAENVSSDDENIADVSVQPPGRVMLTPPSKMDRPVSAKSGASEVSTLTQYTLPPSDGIAEPSREQETASDIPGGSEMPSEVMVETVHAVDRSETSVDPADERLMHPMEKAAEIRKDKGFDANDLSAFLEERRRQQAQIDQQNQQIQTEISLRQADLMAKNEELERKIREITEKKRALEAEYMREFQQPEVPSEPTQDRTRQFVESVRQAQIVREPSMTSQSDGQASLSTATSSQIHSSAVDGVPHGMTYLSDLPMSSAASAGQTMPLDRVRAYQAAALLRRQRNQSQLGTTQLKYRTDQLLAKHAELKTRFTSNSSPIIGYFPSTKSSSTDTSATTSSSGPPSEFAEGIRVTQREVQAPVTYRPEVLGERGVQDMPGYMHQFQRVPSSVSHPRGFGQGQVVQPSPGLYAQEHISEPSPGRLTDYSSTTQDGSTLHEQTPPSRAPEYIPTSPESSSLQEQTLTSSSEDAVSPRDGMQRQTVSRPPIKLSQGQGGHGMRQSDVAFERQAMLRSLLSEVLQQRQDLSKEYLQRQMNMSEERQRLLQRQEEWHSPVGGIAIESQVARDAAQQQELDEVQQILNDRFRSMQLDQTEDRMSEGRLQDTDQQRSRPPVNQYAAKLGGGYHELSTIMEMETPTSERVSGRIREEFHREHAATAATVPSAAPIMVGGVDHSTADEITFGQREMQKAALQLQADEYGRIGTPPGFKVAQQTSTQVKPSVGERVREIPSTGMWRTANDQVLSQPTRPGVTATEMTQVGQLPSRVYGPHVTDNQQFGPSMDDVQRLADVRYQSAEDYRRHIPSTSDQQRQVTNARQQQKAPISVSQTTPDSEMMHGLKDAPYIQGDIRYQQDYANISRISHPSIPQSTAQQIASSMQRSAQQATSIPDAQAGVSYQTTFGTYQPGPLEINGVQNLSWMVQQASVQQATADSSSVDVMRQESDAYPPRVSYQPQMTSSSAMQQPAVAFKTPTVVSGPLEQAGSSFMQNARYEVPFQSYQTEFQRDGRSQQPMFEAAQQVLPDRSQGSLVDGSLSEVSIHTPQMVKPSGRPGSGTYDVSNVRYKSAEIVQGPVIGQRTSGGFDGASYEEAAQGRQEEIAVQPSGTVQFSCVSTHGSQAVEVQPSQFVRPYVEAGTSTVPSFAYTGPQQLGTAAQRVEMQQPFAPSLQQASATQQPREQMLEATSQAHLEFTAPIQVTDHQLEMISSEGSRETVSHTPSGRLQDSQATETVTSGQRLYDAPIQHGRQSWQDVGRDAAHTSYQSESLRIASQSVPERVMQSLYGVSTIPYTATTTMEHSSSNGESANILDHVKYHSLAGSHEPSHIQTDTTHHWQVPYQGTVTIETQDTHKVKPMPATAPSTSVWSNVRQPSLDLASDTRADMRTPPGTLHLASTAKTKVQEGRVSDLAEEAEVDTVSPLKPVSQESQVDRQAHQGPRKEYQVQTDLKRTHLDAVGGVGAQNVDSAQTLVSSQKYGKAVSQAAIESFKTLEVQQGQLEAWEQLHQESVVDDPEEDKEAYATENVSHQPGEKVASVVKVTPQPAPMTHYQARQDFEKPEAEDSVSELKTTDPGLQSPSTSIQPTQKFQQPLAPTSGPATRQKTQTAQLARTVLTAGMEQVQQRESDGFSPMQEDTSIISESSSKTWAEILAADQAIEVKKELKQAENFPERDDRQPQISEQKTAQESLFQLSSPAFDDLHDESEKFTRRSSTPAKTKQVARPGTSEAVHIGLQVVQQEGAAASSFSPAEQYTAVEGLYQPLDLDVSADTTTTSEFGTLRDRMSAAAAFMRSSAETKSSSSDAGAMDDQMSGTRSNYDESLSQHTLDAISAASTSQASPQQSTSEEEDALKPTDDLTLRKRMSVASGLLHPGRTSAGSHETSEIQEGDLTQHFDSSSLPQISMDTTKDHSTLHEQQLSASLTSLVQGHLAKLQEGGTNLPHSVKSYLSQLSRSLSDGKMPTEHLQDLLHNLESMTSLHTSALGGSSTPHSLSQHSFESQTKQSLSSITPISQASLNQRSLLTMTPGSTHSLTQHSITSLTPHSVVHSSTLQSLTPMGATMSEGPLSHYTLPSPILEPDETSQYSNSTTPYPKSTNSKRSVSFASPLSRDSITQHSLPRESHRSSLARESLSQHRVSKTLSRDLSDIPSLSSDSPQSASTLPRETLSQHSVSSSFPNTSSIHSHQMSLSREHLEQQSLRKSLPKDSPTQHSITGQSHRSSLSRDSPTQHSLPTTVSWSPSSYLRDSDRERFPVESLSSDSLTQRALRASVMSTPSQYSDESTPSGQPSRAVVSSYTLGGASSKDSLTRQSLGTTLSRSTLSQHTPSQASGLSPLSQYTLEKSLSSESPQFFKSSLLAKDSPTQSTKDSLQQHSFGSTLSSGAISGHSSISTPSSAASPSQHTVDPSFPGDISSEHSPGSSLSKDSPARRSVKSSASRESSIQQHSMGTNLSKTSLSQHSVDPTILQSFLTQHSIETTQGVSISTSGSLSSHSMAHTDQLSQYPMSVKTTQFAGSLTQYMTGAESSVGQSLSNASLPERIASQLTQHSESGVTLLSVRSITQQTLQSLTQFSLTPSAEQSGNQEATLQSQILKSGQSSLLQQTLSPSMLQMQEHSSGSSESSGSLSQYSMEGNDSKGDMPSHDSPALSPIGSQNLSGESGQGAQFSRIATKLLRAQQSRKISSPGSLNSASSSPNSSGSASSELKNTSDGTGRSLTQYNLSDLTAKSLTQRSLTDITGKSLTQYEINNLSGESGTQSQLPNESGRSLTRHTVKDESGRSLTQYDANSITGQSVTRHSVPDLTQRSLLQGEVSVTGKSLTQCNLSNITGRSLTQYANVTGKSLTQYESDTSGRSLVHRNLSDVASDSSSRDGQMDLQDTLSQYGASHTSGRSLTQRSVTGASLLQHSGTSLMQHGMSYAAPYSLVESSTSGSSGSTLRQNNQTGLSMTQNPHVSGSSMVQHSHVSSSSLPQHSMVDPSLHQQSMVDPSLPQHSMVDPSLPQHLMVDPSSRSLEQYSLELSATGVPKRAGSIPSPSISSLRNVSGDLTQHTASDTLESRSRQGSIEQIPERLSAQRYSARTTTESPSAGSPSLHHLDDSSPVSLRQTSLGNYSGRSGSLLSQHRLESSSMMRSVDDSRHGLSGNASHGLSDSGASPDWARLQTPISHVVRRYVGERSSSLEKSSENSTESPLTRMRTPVADSPVGSYGASANQAKPGSSGQARMAVVDEERPSTSIAAEEMDDPEDFGILEEPNLTFASDISDFSRPVSPQKKQASKSPAGAMERLQVQAESPSSSKISQSLLSFEKHELSALSDLEKTNIDLPQSSATDSTPAPSPIPGTSCERQESSDDESPDDSKVCIVETPSSRGSQRGQSLQEAFERRKADFIKSSEERKAQAKEKAASRSSAPNTAGTMRSTLSAWKRSRALNAAAKSGTDDIPKSPVKSSITKNASDRKKNEKRMKERTKKLYYGLEEVKAKMLEEDRRKQYALNREKAQEYKQKYLQNIRKKWDKKE